MPESSGPLLDVGCGYGPIGLALAKEDSQRNVHMVDVNERALALAQKMLKLIQYQMFQSIKALAMKM